MFDRKLSHSLGQSENLNVNFASAYRYTNFSINIFYVSLVAASDRNANETTTSNDDNEHEVRIYRFWSYDPPNQLPTETSYYVKVVSIINYNNPVFVKNPTRRNKVVPFLNIKLPSPDPPKTQVTNYLINSE